MATLKIDGEGEFEVASSVSPSAAGREVLNEARTSGAYQDLGAIRTDVAAIRSGVRVLVFLAVLAFLGEVVSFVLEYQRRQEIAERIEGGRPW